MKQNEIPVRQAAMNEARHLEDSVVAGLRTMGYEAESTGGDASLSDVLVRARVPRRDLTFYIEVKKARAQFGTPRINWNGSRWEPTKASATDGFALQICHELNFDPAALRFMEDLRHHVSDLRGFTDGWHDHLKQIRLVRSDGGKAYRSRDPHDPVVKPRELLHFIRNCRDGRGERIYNQDIVHEQRDVAPLVRKHYLSGKKEPALYLQWDDNFYTLSRRHPFGGHVSDGGRIPMFWRVPGDFRISIAFASDKRYYFIVPRVEPTAIVPSRYSLLAPMKPGSGKVFPFPPADEAHENLIAKWRSFRTMLSEADRRFREAS